MLFFHVWPVSFGCQDHVRMRKVDKHSTNSYILSACWEKWESRRFSSCFEPWFWKVLFICDPFRFTLVYPINQRLTVPENRTIQICYIMFTNLHAFMKECKTTKSYTLILPIHSPHQAQVQNAFDALIMWNRAKAKPTVDRSFCGTVCTRLRQNSIRHNIEPRETRWKTGQCGNVSVAQNPTILKPCFIVFGDRFGRVWSVYRSLHRVHNPNIFDLPMILV